MKLITSKVDLGKKHAEPCLFLDGKLKTEDFINSNTIKIIDNNLDIYRQLLSEEKKPVKIKYFYDRIKSYNNYLKFLEDTLEKNITKTPFAFYSSTTNLINRGNYALRIDYALNMFNANEWPLFIFLEEPIFHSMKEFRITIIKEKIVLDFNRHKFSEIKNNISYWDKKIKQDIGSYVENLSFKNKEWLKDRYCAVFDFVFKLIITSNSYEELAQKLTFECLLSEDFRGVISSQADLISLLKNKVDLKKLFDDRDIEIDIIRCSTCGQPHEGPFRKSSSGKIPCGDLSWPIIFNSKIRFKKALLPFVSLFYLNIVPILSNYNYFKNIENLEPKNKLNKGDVCFLLKKIKYKSLFKESMNYINFLAEGINEDMHKNIKNWDNKKDIIIDNQSFYKVKNKQTDFVAIDKLKIPEEISCIIKKREELRMLKKWQEADALRTKLVYLGIDLMEINGNTLVREIA